MAYTVQVIRGATTYTVTGGTYSNLVAMQGIGAPTKRNIAIRGPFQHGQTITDFRYDARQITLVFHAYKATLSAADTNRDSLYDIWKGVSGTPVKLKVTRDDSTALQIDGEVTGVVDMDNDLQNRIGTSQRFAVRLECGDPFFYNPTQSSTSFTSADNVSWELALGTITSGEVEEAVTTPTQGQSVDNAVLVANGSPWAIFFQTNVTTLPPASSEYPFNMNDSGDTTSVFGFLSSTLNRITTNTGNISGAFATGLINYFITSDGSDATLYRESTSIGSVGATKGIDGSQSNTVWRAENSSVSSPWTPELPYAAIYNIELSASQRSALISAVSDGGYAASKTIAYAGSWRAYPVVTIEGPITDPVLTNTSTGDKLDFTGTTISSGDTYTIDCRYGFKTVKDAAGTNKIADLSSDSDLATFHLAPDPEVSSGNNALTLTGTGTDANTEVTVAYNERHVGL